MLWHGTKERTTLEGIALACLIVLFLWPPKITLYGRYGEEIILACPLPDVPNEMPRLKVVDREITPELVKSIAEDVFGFTGEVEEEPYPEGALRIWAPPHHLLMYPTGGIGYGGPEPPTSIITLTNDEAKAIAENFLENMRTYGLMPQNPDINVIFDDVKPGATTSTGEIRYLRVSYSFKFKDFPMYEDFPGRARAIVNIWEGGIVTGFALVYKEVEENGTVQRVTPMEALRAFAPESPFGLEWRKAIVKQIDIAYYYSTYEKQDYLNPIYLFTITLTKEGRQKDNVIVTMTAISEPYRIY
jgi:hypothetical protein